MEHEPHLLKLRSVGRVLLVVGLLDIAFMIYCIVNGISYSSSLNIFAVVAGIFLIRGSLRAAVVVRWIALLLLVSFIGIAVVWPFLQPIDLTLTQARLYPAAVATTTLFYVAFVALAWWVQHTLGRPEILAARDAAGKKRRNMRIPVALGIVGVVASVALLSAILDGETADRAKRIAAEQLGEGYRYHVSSLSMSSNSQTTRVAARVTAWNDEEVLNVPVEWQE